MISVSWDNGFDDHQENFVDWDFVAFLLRKLDGKSRTLVSLEKGDACLMVGGGPEIFVVSATLDQKHFHTLIDPRKDPKGKCAVVAGQPGIYPLTECVDLDSVFLVAQYFAENYGIAPEAVWRIS